MIRARQESLASAQQASQQIEEEIARDQEYNGDAEPGSLDEITKMLAPKAQAAEERARSDAAVNEASRQVAAAEDELKRVQLDAEGACRAFVLGLLHSDARDSVLLGCPCDPFDGSARREPRPHRYSNPCAYGS